MKDIQYWVDVGARESRRSGGNSIKSGLGQPGRGVGGGGALASSRVSIINFYRTPNELVQGSIRMLFDRESTRCRGE